MRVISMQGKVVWDILLRDGVYYANVKLSREHNDYSRDIERLNGYIPIWCYYWPEISYYTIYNGEVLDYLRMETSLERANCWDDFVMFELEIPDDEVYIGFTHNASSYTKITPVLRLDMVKAVYYLRDANILNPYWKVIKPIWISEAGVTDVITMEELNCEQITELVEESTYGLVASTPGKCLWCCKEVSHVIDEKHFCCLAHMWEHRRKFIRYTDKEGISRQKSLQIYDHCTDNDFAGGIVKAIKKGNIISVLETTLAENHENTKLEALNVF